jgi:hypothetical protein
MDEKTLYNTPINNSWGAVTFVNHTGLLTPDHPQNAIPLDKDNKPLYQEDARAYPGKLDGFIVVHRRTGDPRPTEGEIKVCEAWKKTLSLLDLRFVDFIIICGASHYSFANEKVEGPGPKGF